MSGKPEADVAFFGGTARVRVALKTGLRRFGASVRCFEEPGQCLKEVSQKAFGLFVLDFDGHTAAALNLLAGARKNFPSIRPLALVDHGDIRTAVEAMKAGANDCLEKPVEPPRLLAAVEAALSEGLPSRPAALTALTPTETQILSLVLAGKTSGQAAKALHRSRRTVEVHRHNIMRKFRAHGIVDLVKQALRMGFIDLDDWGHAAE